MSIFAALNTAISTHMADPHSGLTAMDRMTLAALERQGADGDTTALVGFLTRLSERQLSVAAKQDLAQAAATLPGAPSFGRDPQQEAREACTAMIRGRFQSEGMALPDADPEEPESEEGAEDSDGWSDMSFGDEPEAATPPAAEAINLAIAGIMGTASRHPKGYNARLFAQDLGKVSGSKAPVIALAGVLERHTEFLAIAVPMMAADAGFAQAIDQSTLPDTWKQGFHTGLAQAREALAAGHTLSGVLLAVVLEAVSP